jgi:hypothetical protein
MADQNRGSTQAKKTTSVQNTNAPEAIKAAEVKPVQPAQPPTSETGSGSESAAPEDPKARRERIAIAFMQGMCAYHGGTKGTIDLAIEYADILMAKLDAAE